MKKVLLLFTLCTALIAFAACKKESPEYILPEGSALATATPTTVPTEAPQTEQTKEPDASATTEPTKTPTKAPTSAPTKAPTQAPTKAPTQAPTKAPTQAPTKVPTQAPTPTSVPANSNDITYTFNDLKYYTAYGTFYTIDEEGVISLQYSDLYQEIKLSLPEPIDMSKCTGVTVRMKSEVGHLAIKLYDETFNEVFVRYDGKSVGVINHKLNPHISTPVYGIGLMACDETLTDYSKFAATVYSVTFHMKK